MAGKRLKRLRRGAVSSNTTEKKTAVTKQKIPVRSKTSKQNCVSSFCETRDTDTSFKGVVKNSGLKIKHAKVNKKIMLNPSLNFSQWLFDTCLKGRKVSHGPFNFDSEPFNHVTVSELISDETFLTELSSELLQLPFETMLNDMYSFHQTDSLFDIKANMAAVKKLLNFISGPLKSWIEKITGKTFSKKVTVTASKYTSSDRLLCHDDNLSDRSVAFVFYLCKDWKVDDGGSLDLFECDSENQPRSVVKSIFPNFGSFVFFEVSRVSYHQVSEILSNKCRLSVNGWYHAEDLPAHPKWIEPSQKMCNLINLKGCSLSQWVCPWYIDSGLSKDSKENFEKESYHLISDFLLPNIDRDLTEAFKDPSVKWIPQGPASRKKYEIANIDSLPAILKDFVNLLRSKSWLKFLSNNYVNIDLKSLNTPKYYLELQRWQPGDYTLLMDDDSLNQLMGLDLYFHFDVSKDIEQDGGEVYYFGPERDERGYLKSGEHVPTFNSHFYVQNRMKGMATATHYVTHQIEPFYKVYVHYSLKP